MAACQNKHLSVVEFLLTLRQTDVNIKDEVVLILLLALPQLVHSDYSCFSQKGINALMYASHGGNLDIIQALLNHPDVDINEISDVCKVLF